MSERLLGLKFCPCPVVKVPLPPVGKLCEWELFAPAPVDPCRHLREPSVVRCFLGEVERNLLVLGKSY